MQAKGFSANWPASERATEKDTRSGRPVAPYGRWMLVFGGHDKVRSYRPTLNGAATPEILGDLR